MQTKGLKLKEEYELIKDEMERADEYAAVLQADRFSTAAAILASVALIVAVLTVDPGAQEWSGFHWLKDRAFFTLSVGITVFGFITWGIAWLRRR